ncbi:hypothetical protein QYF61_013723 [Mycteria americana]|uniref:Uncharacterized protein n=1 Tax=Mycteria americana TaxID=33587 RepID=A0AAN7MMH9_MYCAM|nr:hypothetical protein QYF61_013723 [Mycteria americana]
MEACVSRISCHMQELFLVSLYIQWELRPLYLRQEKPPSVTNMPSRAPEQGSSLDRVSSTQLDKPSLTRNKTLAEVAK